MKNFIKYLLLVGALLLVPSVSLATVSYPFQGGTGTGVAPTAGQILIGTSGNLYTPTFLTAGTGVTISTSSGAITLNASGGGSVSTSSPITTGYFPYWFNTTGGLNGTSSIFQSGLNIGIGTTAPSSTLHVIGAIQQSFATSSYAAFDSNGKLVATSTPLLAVVADSPLSGSGTSGSHLIFTNPGYITTSTYNGNFGTMANVNSPAPIANGGTATTTAAGARTNLGIGTIGTFASTDYNTSSSIATIAHGGTNTSTIPKGNVISDGTTLSSFSSAVNAYQSAAQTVSSSVFTTVKLQTKLFDLNNEFSTSTNLFTAKVAGYYMETGKVQWATASAGGLFALRLNSGGVGNINWFRMPTGDEDQSVFAVPQIRFLGVGDTVFLDVYQTTGSDRTLDAGDGATFLSVARIQ